ncbi:MAG TPA: hypothetical protein PLY86_13605 [bacterium]|nr:hypothetical protein [bacterium]
MIDLNLRQSQFRIGSISALRRVVLIGLFVCTSVSLRGEIPTDLYPSIETSVDKNEITIGDDILCTVKITYDPSITIEGSTPGMDLGQFEIKDVRIGTPERVGNRMVRNDVYVLSTYFTGDYTFPPITVRFRTESGEMGEVKTDAIDVHVRELTSEESENLTIRDIKPPVSVEGRSRWPLVLGIGAGVLLVAAGIIWLLFLRRRDEVEVALEPPLPPHERALMALQALRENRELLASKQYKEFSTRLSDILRVYIHGRWSLAAMDLTTEEILMKLRGQGIPSGIQENIAEIFSSCDLMKYARQETDTDNAVRLIDLAVHVVEISREIIPDVEPRVPEQPVVEATVMSQRGDES